MYVTISNPFLPKNQGLAWFANCLQPITIFSSIAILPLQFYYRYRVFNNTPLTSYQLLKIFVLVCAFPTLHGSFCIVTFSERTAETDNIMLDANLISNADDIPNYVVGDSAHNSMMTLHFLDCAVISVGSYVLVLVFHQWTTKTLDGKTSLLSARTKKIRREMSKLVIVQVR